MMRSLDELRDIHLPPAPGAALSWFDPWAWALLALALCVITAMLAWRYGRRPQRQALRAVGATVRDFRRDGDALAALRRLSHLLRRHAARRFPESAGLAGADWLAFLDAHGGKGRFSDTPGSALADMPYRPACDQPVDVCALAELVRQWLRSNP